MFNQKKELHNLWTEQVYQKIQKQISDRMGNMDNDELNERLNSVFQKYIDTVDNKRVRLLRGCWVQASAACVRIAVLGAVAAYDLCVASYQGAVLCAVATWFLCSALCICLSYFG